MSNTIIIRARSAVLDAIESPGNYITKLEFPPITGYTLVKYEVVNAAFISDETAIIELVAVYEKSVEVK